MYQIKQQMFGAAKTEAHGCPDFNSDKGVAVCTE